MALPHFTQITSHNSNWEPSYKNLYEVEILLPTDIASMHTNSKTLLLENTTSAKMPVYPTLTTASQKYKYSTRLFVGFPDSTSITDLTFVFNVNQNDSKQLFTFRMIKDWYDLVWNNEDGSSNYKSKVVGEIIVYQHDREGEVIRRVTYHNCQITGFSGMEDLIWGGGADIHELTAIWAVDWWEDYYF
jgi:hypothetical protein